MSASCNLVLVYHVNFVIGTESQIYERLHDIKTKGTYGVCMYLEHFVLLRCMSCLMRTASKTPSPQVGNPQGSYH
jgi:hypothetical protein